MIEYHRFERSTDICQVMAMVWVFLVFDYETLWGRAFVGLRTKRPTKWLRAGQRIRMCRDVALAMVRWGQESDEQQFGMIFSHDSNQPDRQIDRKIDGDRWLIHVSSRLLCIVACWLVCRMFVQGYHNYPWSYHRWVQWKKTDEFVKWKGVSPWQYPIFHWTSWWWKEG